MLHRKTITASLALAFALPATAFTATAANAQVFTQWTFDNLAVATNNSPAASTGIGTALGLGMTNSYTYSTTPAVTGSVNTDDVLALTGSSNSSASNQAWRIRGNALDTTTGTGNGWNTAAPEYSQGAEFDTSTVGYTNIVVTYDWYSTAQGVRDLQEQYNTNINNASGWTNIGALQVASPNAFINGITINLATVAGANNDPNFGIRLVSAYDPTYTGTGAPTYTSATLTGGQPVVYNNNSGNWRFDTVTFSGTAITSGAATPEPTSVAMLLLGSASAGIAVIRRRGAAKSK